MDEALASNLIHRVNVGDALTRTASRHPEQEAVIDGDRRLTYAELEAWANRFAHALAARGYRPGDSLALMSGNSAEFLVTYYACAKLGVVCVPLNLGWRESETAYVLGHAKARGVVVESQLLEKLVPALASTPGVTDLIVAVGLNAPIPGVIPGCSLLPFAQMSEGQPATPPEVTVGDRDPVSYLYTSGTTAAPKGAVGSHLAIHIESLTVAVDCGLQRHDRVLCMMPMFHTAQLNAICTPSVTVGATLVVLRAFDATTLVDLSSRERLTVLFALPMMYRALVEAIEASKKDVKTVRLAIYAMAPMPDADLRKAMTVLGCEFSLLFGQTEMSPVSCFFRPEHQLSHMGAVGTPSVNVQVDIMDPDGKLLPRGERGEIVYRSPHVIERYLADEEATRTAFRHGWFHSGDVGWIGLDGMLWFDDRFKDVIKTGGENVASIEVEKMVFAVEPAIAQAVVIGLPHERWGEAITVVVVLRPDTQIVPAAVLAKMKEKLTPFKVPKAIVVVDAMPMTSTGKIQKNVLRAQLKEHYK